MSTVVRASRGTSDAEFENAGSMSLLKRLMHELTTLFRQEVAPGTSEVVRALSTLAERALSLATGVAVLFAGFLVLLTAAVLGLSTVVAPCLAAARLLALCRLMALSQRRMLLSPFAGVGTEQPIGGTMRIGR